VGTTTITEAKNMRGAPIDRVQAGESMTVDDRLARVAIRERFA